MEEAAVFHYYIQIAGLFRVLTIVRTYMRSLLTFCLTRRADCHRTLAEVPQRCKDGTSR